LKNNFDTRVRALSKDTLPRTRGTKLIFNRPCPQSDRQRSASVSEGKKIVSTSLGVPAVEAGDPRAALQAVLTLTPEQVIADDLFEPMIEALSHLDGLQARLLELHFAAIRESRLAQLTPEQRAEIEERDRTRELDRAEEEERKKAWEATVREQRR